MRIDWADPAARRAHLGELVALGRTLLEATATDEGLAEARDLLARIIDQNVEDDPDDGAGPQIRRGVAKDRVCSVVDPEMRHGRKTVSQRVDGYKSHVVTDYRTELVLGVRVTAANQPDGPQASMVGGYASTSTRLASKPPGPPNVNRRPVASSDDDPSSSESSARAAARDEARYRGTRKVLLQQRLTAGMLNVKRLFTLDIDLGALPCG